MERPVLLGVIAVLCIPVGIVLGIAMALLGEHLILGFWSRVAILSSAMIAVMFLPGLSNKRKSKGTGLPPP